MILKKIPVRITGETCYFERHEEILDRYLMVHRFILREAQKEDGYNVRQCLHMFGVSKSGYYRWKKKQEEHETRQQAAQEEFEALAQIFKKIIKKLGFVPGKRTFHEHLWRDYGINISIKKCRKIMKRMSLEPNRPKKDAYKHRATHDHEAASPANLVNQEFYIGPRRIILTDITYLYYGVSRAPIYLCAFKDAYTKEILGCAVDTRMTVELVKSAYEQMKEQHGSELYKAETYIHSDQGSQYLSTTFKRMLEDDEFIQSVSGRGNSQDNAPMESFFGRMKTAILDLVALCKDATNAKKMITNYIDLYNHKMYQYNLAGLTPHEFYLYCTTGIYPLDTYYGVQATELRTINDLVNDRLEKARKKAEKARIANAKRREKQSAIGREPVAVLARDQRIIRSKLRQWEKQKETTDTQIKFLNNLLEKTKEAGRFFGNLVKEELERFRDLTIWKDYPELSYVFDMKGMF